MNRMLITAIEKLSAMPESKEKWYLRYNMQMQYFRLFFQKYPTIWDDDDILKSTGKIIYIHKYYGQLKHFLMLTHYQDDYHKMFLPLQRYPVVNFTEEFAQSAQQFAFDVRALAKSPHHRPDPNPPADVWPSTAP